MAVLGRELGVLPVVVVTETRHDDADPTITVKYIAPEELDIGARTQEGAQGLAAL